jgi:hypothetical protein
MVDKNLNPASIHRSNSPSPGLHGTTIGEMVARKTLAAFAQELRLEANAELSPAMGVHDPLLRAGAKSLKFSQVLVAFDFDLLAGNLTTAHRSPR